MIGPDGSVETTSDATPIDIANARSVSITITDDLSKREIWMGCQNGDQVSAVQSSISEAKDMARGTISYIKENQGRDELYKAYFGNNNPSDVISNYRFIVDTDTHKVNTFCTDPICSDNSRDAINPTGTDDIFFCGRFFDQKSLSSLCKKEVSATAKDLRGGTTLRMLARAFVPGVAGQERNCEQSRGLSDFDKITNNDNYEASTQTSHCLPRVRVLTWDRHLCSASPPRSLPGSGVKWVM